MKSKIVLIALALFSAQASAGWELVAESDNSNSYVDFSTVRTKGIYTYAWLLEDLFVAKTTSGKKYLSTKILMVYKCDDMQAGAKTILGYSKKMGDGDVVETYEAEIYEVDFADVVPESVGESKLKAVCERAQ